MTHTANVRAVAVAAQWAFVVQLELRLRTGISVASGAAIAPVAIVDGEGWSGSCYSGVRLAGEIAVIASSLNRTKVALITITVVVVLLVIGGAALLLRSAEEPDAVISAQSAEEPDAVISAQSAEEPDAVISAQSAEEPDAVISAQSGRGA